jgi:IclR family transcriptional regulator, pca regulon regulatory protein
MCSGGVEEPMDRPMTPEDDPEFVNSLARGLAVIRAFSKEAPEMTLSEMAGRTGLTRAAARRFLLTLERLGYVCTDGRRFRLAPKILDLGFAYLSSINIWDLAMPHMEQVSEEVRESCSASVLEGYDIVYVARVPTERIMSVALNLGARLPAFATSMGRVLLAFLPQAKARERILTCPKTAFTPCTVTDPDELWAILEQVRRQSWALVDQELELGLRSIAVPIRNKRGRVLAAMNVSGHVGRVTPEQMVKTYLPALQRATQRITEGLAG